MSKRRSRVLDGPGPKAIRHAAMVMALCNQSFDPAADGRIEAGRITESNASLFVQANFSEELTTYAAGWKDPNNIQATLDFFAPPCEAPKRFEYAQAVNAEEFYSDTDDLRPIRSDFGSVEYTSTKVNDKLENRGLRLIIDIDEVSDPNTWAQKAVDKLMRRLQRNSLRRAIAALSAAAVNTAKTWDGTAGKDPDGDILTELVAARTASGVSPNRVGFGDTSWTKRQLSLRAQNSPAGYSSAALPTAGVASLLGVDQVAVSKERYISSGTTKSEIVNTLVLMFMAMDGADLEDPSNIKRFWCPCDDGSTVKVYIRQISTKLWEVVIEKYEAIRITSTLGIRQFTVS